MNPNRIFLSPPHMGGDELEFVRQAFASNYIAPLGPMVDASENDFTRYTGIQHCVAVASGTAAMHLTLHCLGIGRDDEVIASTLTFIGSVTPILFHWRKTIRYRFGPTREALKRRHWRVGLVVWLLH